MFISSEYFSVLSGGRNRYGQQAIIDQLLVNDHSPGSSISVCKRMDPRKMDMTDCSFLKNLFYCHGFHVCFPDPVCHKFRNVLGIWGIVYGFGQISNINGGISILALHMPNIAICLFDPFFINDCPGKIFGKGLTDQGILHILKNFLFFCFNP